MYINLKHNLCTVARNTDGNLHIVHYIGVHLDSYHTLATQHSQRPSRPVPAVPSLVFSLAAPVNSGLALLVAVGLKNVPLAVPL